MRHLTALFAVVVMPVTQRKREVARSLTCLGNVRCLATSVLSYVQDNDERLRPSSGRPDVTWPLRMSEYIANFQVLECPKDLSLRKTRMSSRADNGFYGSSYEYNVDLSGRKLKDVPAPAKEIMLQETLSRHFGDRNLAFVDGHAEGPRFRQ